MMNLRTILLKMKNFMFRSLLQVFHGGWRTNLSFHLSMEEGSLPIAASNLFNLMLVIHYSDVLHKLLSSLYPQSVTCSP